VAQHKVVIDAAKPAGVALFAYTSSFGDHVAPLSQAHRGTEEALVESGLPYTLLRNNWYSEIFTDQLPQVLEHGAVVHAAGDGRLASATRADYAAAAVATLTGEGHENKTYELSGDVAWSFAEYAAEVSRQTGQEIVYKALTTDAFADMLVGSGMPAMYAKIMAGTGETIAQGELAGTPGELSRLIGRPTTPIEEAIASALK
jgi:NAD(P)H dehydrogenase (quinone)